MIVRLYRSTCAFVWGWQGVVYFASISRSLRTPWRKTEASCGPLSVSAKFGQPRPLMVNLYVLAVRSLNQRKGTVITPYYEFLLFDVEPSVCHGLRDTERFNLGDLINSLGRDQRPRVVPYGQVFPVGFLL